MSNAVRTMTPPRRASTPVKEVRKDVQGLRAIAVLLVVIAHLWPAWLPGGYVGVDVFFVISGFLMTKHLLSELGRTGGVRLGVFYLRRIKRLLPAALTVALVSLAAAWAFLPFPRWASLAWETIAATVYIENWVLADKSLDYSADNAAPSTVQHYWSLSVEEQFYLVWPLFLLGLFLLASRWRLPSVQVVRGGLAAAGVLSLFVCIHLTYTSPSEAYFVTQTRVWEFAAGGLIATVLTLPRSRAGAGLLVSGAAQWAGLGLILFAAVSFSDETPFPGAAALVPVVGTLLVLVSGPHHPGWSPNTLLAAPPAQFIGDISYSLYLWHWPLIVLAPSILNRDPALGDEVLLLAVAVALAALTKSLIEDPGRSVLLAGASFGRVLSATAASMAVVTAVAAAMIISVDSAERNHSAVLKDASRSACFGAGGLQPDRLCPDPLGPPATEVVTAAESYDTSPPECGRAADPLWIKKANRLIECDFAGGADPAATVWLVGDSHAEQWQAAIFELARQNRWMVKKSVVDGCPVVDVPRVAFKGKPTTSEAYRKKCLKWSGAVSERITAEKPELVFVSSFGVVEKIDDGSGRSQPEQYRDGFARRALPWAEAGIEVFVLRDTPLTIERTTAECLAQNPTAPRACSNDGADALPADPLAEAAKAARSDRIKVLDLSDHFCPDGRCYASIGGANVYYDDNHVTSTYMRSLAPALAADLEASRAG
ncbi:acyltransferase family protein [Arthrobacter zhaoguopingii]|uniref:acyltransferase family protein n=1 Tax=Arthrobacter zhaoguopingii TaxID=2681491 RepID=UPI0013583889|nr:acyltransferase family protein [Arthrobacter zhaoguopingii]